MADVLRAIIDQAHTQPDHAAVKDLETDLSYMQLLDDVARVATGLKAHGVLEGDRVALRLPNSVDFVVAALATLWVGAIFVPLAVDDPEIRLAAIIANCTPKIVVTTADLARERGVNALGQTTLLSVSTLRGGDEELIGPINAAPRVAYIIYTSGTTGTPKGVQIGSVAFGAAVQSASEALGLTRSTRTLCVSPFHFDGSFGTLFPTLFSGGAVIIRPRDALLFPRTFFNTVASEAVTYTGFSPSYLRLLLGSARMSRLADSDLEVIALGGEASSLADVRALAASAPKVRVFNRYGPTETAIAVTHMELTSALIAAGSLPLGRPHANVTFYLVNDAGKNVETTGEVGELHIGGVQVMDGYWGDVELTNAVLRRNDVSGENVYRTGDLVFLDESGNYVYVDRADRVVKRSGIRISLIELSEVIRRLPNVSAAASMTFDNEGELGIVVFVVVSSPVTSLDLLRAAREYLPDTMLPNRIEFVDELPLNKSSKLDERLLLSRADLSPFAAVT